MLVSAESMRAEFHASLFHVAPWPPGVPKAPLFAR